MKRVNITLLDNRDGIFYYVNSLYTGVAFDVAENGKVQGFYVNGGLKQRQYKNQFWPLIGSDAMHIESSFLESEKDPFLYQGHPLDGVTYEFDDGVCVAEVYFIAGVLCHEANWDYEGNLEFLEIDEEDLSQEYQWHGNGKVSTIEIFRKDSFRARYRFNEGGDISTIWIDGDYFKCFGEIQSRLKFKSPGYLSSFSDLSLSTDIFLAGSAVSDQLFESLSSAKGFESITKLSLDKTSLSKDIILGLTKLKHLKSLDVVDERDDLKSILQELKAKSNDCYVELNSQELNA